MLALTDAHEAVLERIIRENPALAEKHRYLHLAATLAFSDLDTAVAGDLRAERHDDRVIVFERDADTADWITCASFDAYDMQMLGHGQIVTDLLDFHANRTPHADATYTNPEIAAELLDMILTGLDEDTASTLLTQRLAALIANADAPAPDAPTVSH